MSACLRRSLPTRRLLRFLSVPFVVLALFLASPGVALAATPAPGSVVFTRSPATYAMSLSCSVPNCSTGQVIAQVTTVNSGATINPSSATSFGLRGYATDPRQLTGWNSGSVSAAVADAAVTWQAPRVQGNGTSAQTFSAEVAAPVKFVTFGQRLNTSDVHHLVWEIGDLPPPPDDEPPPPPSGAACGATPEEPCYVHQVNSVPVEVGDIEVSSLTQDQWNELLLGLGALVFFSGAGFVASWRHGRTR